MILVPFGSPDIAHSNQGAHSEHSTVSSPTAFFGTSIRSPHPPPAAGLIECQNSFKLLSHTSVTSGPPSGWNSCPRPSRASFSSPHGQSHECINSIRKISLSLGYSVPRIFVFWMSSSGNKRAAAPFVAKFTQAGLPPSP